MDRKWWAITTGRGLSWPLTILMHAAAMIFGLLFAVTVGNGNQVFVVPGYALGLSVLRGLSAVIWPRSQDEHPQGQTLTSAERAARESAIQYAAERKRHRSIENAKILVIVFVQIGLIAPAAIVAPATADLPPGTPPPSFVPVAVLIFYVVFGALAYWQWRRAKAKESAYSANPSYRCHCGRPRNNYFWLHYAVCAVVIPWGYAALLFRLKKCRGCGTPYDSSAALTASETAGARAT